MRYLEKVEVTMIISHKRKFIFFRPNGKCGTTSIENALRKYHDGPKQFLETKDNTNMTHIPPRYLFLNPENEAYKDYFKFAVVRNPYDWYLSLHRWTIRNKIDESSSMKTLGKIKTYEEKNDNYYEPTEYTWDSPENSFDAKRVNEVLSVINMVDYMWDNQICGLCFRGKLMVDAVIKFEELQQGFNSIMWRLGLPREQLGHSRKKKDYDKWKSYSHYYSRDGMKAVEQICDFDFHVFGYKKESKLK